MELLQALAASPLAMAMGQSAVLYPLVNAVHILGLGLLFGAVTVLDLRLLGLFRAAPLQVLAPPLWRVAGCGLAIAVLTGIGLFSTRPLGFVENPAFLAKLALVALGLLNALAVHLSPPWRRAMAGQGIHPGLRGAAALSLLTWTGAILAGRWIGFL